MQTPGLWTSLDSKDTKGFTLSSDVDSKSWWGTFSGLVGACNLS